MKAIELQAMRKFFMLDVREAAEIIGKVSPRSWQYWESGKVPVPDDVADLMSGAATQRQYVIDRIDIETEEASETLSYPLYKTHADYVAEHPGEGVLPWRLYQSAVAELYVNGVIALSEAREDVTD